MDQTYQRRGTAAAVILLPRLTRRFLLQSGNQVGQAIAAAATAAAAAAAAFGGGPVRLLRVTGDDHARMIADARDQHEHLFRRAVLHLVGNDKRAVKGTTAHISQRNHFDLFLEGRRKERGQNVDHGTGPGVHFRGQGPRQKSEGVFAVDGHDGTGQDDAVHVAARQGTRGFVTRQPGFPRACTPDGDDHANVGLLQKVLVDFLLRGFAQTLARLEFDFFHAVGCGESNMKHAG